jgi:hypothetical protein
MAHHREDLPPDLQDVADRLRSNRVEANGLELDQIKLRAMSRARSRTGGNVLRSRLIAVLLTGGLLVGGTGGVIAASGGGGGGNGAANSQYCPPSSPQAGKAKPPTASPPGCGRSGKSHP